MIGTRLAHYEITSHLGSGGMGDVYQATDSKLGRSVAIKLLPPAFASDPDRLSRFRREAQVLASLNHPNIAHIYGIEESGDTRCIVMELVEGETLQARIERGPIPVDETLPIAIQIAEALEAAHEKGVVHRDLKPANVKITPDGKVKVLDFGLAKALEGTAAPSTLSNSPTMVNTLGGTNAGMIIGTAAYMSPEQCKGRNVDFRCDIWAFGCVLYEMLAGKQAFAGETVVEILSAILRTDPNWTALPNTTPHAVHSLLKRCLQKERNRRMRDITDARFQIEEALTEPARSVVAIPPVRKSRERLVWIAGMLVLILSMAFLYIDRAPAGAAEMRLEISTPPSYDPNSFAISPDGRKLVFQAAVDGKVQLWLRPLDSEAAKPLAGTEGVISPNPFWSPDSQSIGFIAADGRMKRIDLDSGLVRTLVSAWWGAWNKDGTILFSSSDTGPLKRIPAVGGDVVDVTRVDPPRVTGHWDPSFLPDGRHFVFFSWGTPEYKGVYLGSLDSMETQRLFDSDTPPKFAPPDYLLFARQGALMAQRLDLKTLKPAGDSVTVTGHVFAWPFQAAVSASLAGPIAYRPVGPERQLVWVDRSGRETGTVGAPDHGLPQFMRLSPDGRTVALSRNAVFWADIWLTESGTGVPQPLTSEAANKFYPIWSPKGDRIVFVWDPKGVLELYEKPIDGVGNGTLLWSSPEHKWTMDWSADGGFVLFRSDSQKTGRDLWAIPYPPPSGETKPLEVAHQSFDEDNGRFSPDGRWVAYQSNETGRYEIVVQPFPGSGSGKKRITTDGGTVPQWRGDGRELFYLSPDNHVMAVSITMNGSTVEAGKPAPLFLMPPQSEFAVSADGQRFLVNKIVKDAPPITILLNWKPKPLPLSCSAAPR